MFPFKSLFDYFNALTGTIRANKTEVCIGEGTQIIFEAIEGKGPFTFTYQINTGAETNISTTGDATTVSLNFDAKSATGTFEYKLIKIKDSEDTETTISSQSVTVRVNPPPTVNFTFTNDNSCSGETVQFNASAIGSGNFSYLWDFGDGKTSTLQNPTNVYTDILGCNTKDFNVKLNVTDGNGCSSEITKSVTVKEKPNLVIFDLDEKDFSNCDRISSDPEYEISVGLDASTSICLNNLIISWGDGTSENLTRNSFPIKHKYSELGVFNLSVTGNSSNGCSVEVNALVKNISNPVAGIVNPGATQNVCAPTDVIPFSIVDWYKNSLDTRYEVNYGDGTTLTLLQQDLINSIYYNNSNPANSQNYPVPHTYESSSCPSTYTVNLKVINACTTTEANLPGIRILKKPKLDFSFDENACVNKSITFNNLSEYGFRSDCFESGRFSWDFGDGTVSASTTDITTQNHIYSNPGTYTVKLLATSFCGPIEISKTICIEPEITPSFNVNALEGCIPFQLNTTNSTDLSQVCSTPTYDWSVNYQAANCDSSSDWEFADNTDKRSENPKFLFKKAGNYTVIRKISTECGDKITSKVINVKKPPTATINPITNFCGTATINPAAVIQNCTQNSGNITYNWTFTGGIPASSSSLNPGEIVYSTPGNYTLSLEVTSECGVSNIATQTFTVSEKPTITNTNLTQEICSNQSTAEIALTSTNLLTTYTWSATASPGISGFIPSGVTNTIPARTITNSANTAGIITYRVTPKLGNCIGEVKEFTVTVNPTPIVTTQPQSSEVCLNGSANLLQVAYDKGTGTPAYQWFVNTTNSTSGGTIINGAIASSYDPPTNTVGTNYYYVEISFNSGGCSKIVSNTATVTVTPQLTIDSVATNQTICVGGTASEFEVSFSGGTGTPSYQWFSNNTNSNSGGNIISGATSATYTPPSFNAVGSFYYYVRVSLTGNGCNQTFSDVYQVNVIPDPIIDAQPLASQELCQNAIPADLSVVVSGGTASNKTYQWYRNNANSTIGGTAIVGATNSSYTPSSATIGTRYYYVIASQSDSGCSVTSAVSSVKINEAPVITSQPQSSEVCLGENATTLEVAYQNGVGIATHQWFFTSINSNTGGTAIIGATNTSYIPPTNAIGTIYYYVEINFTDGGCSKIVSDVATVIVNQIPVIANDSITIYSSETFTYNPSILNGNIVPNNTQYTWIVSSINPAGSIIGSSNAISPQNIINQTLENTGTTPARVTYTISPFTDKCKGSDFTLEVVVNPTITPNEVIT
ncbi:PKD domain-containing protein, partial [Polaribacter sp.]